MKKKYIKPHLEILRTRCQGPRLPRDDNDPYSHGGPAMSRPRQWTHNSSFMDKIGSTEACNVFNTGCHNKAMKLEMHGDRALHLVARGDTGRGRGRGEGAVAVYRFNLSEAWGPPSGSFASCCRGHRKVMRSCRSCYGIVNFYSEGNEGRVTSRC